ncbi:MAG: hypothetical protein ABJB76_02925, partial [Candidatus Nitrosocosmicus sp.]
YVQREFKYAIDNYDQFPESDIYIIPVRLDNCDIPFEKLEEIQHVDLFPDWDNGLNQIFESFKAQGIEFTKEIDMINNIPTKVEEKESEWQKGLNEKEWKDLLTLICKKNAFLS